MFFGLGKSPPSPSLFPFFHPVPFIVSQRRLRLVVFEPPCLTLLLFFLILFFEIFFSPLATPASLSFSSGLRPGLLLIHTSHVFFFPPTLLTYSPRPNLRELEPDPDSFCCASFAPLPLIFSIVYPSIPGPPVLHTSFGFPPPAPRPTRRNAPSR